MLKFQRQMLPKALVLQLDCAFCMHRSMRIAMLRRKVCITVKADGEYGGMSMSNQIVYIDSPSWSLAPPEASSENAVLFSTLALALAGDTRLLTPALEARGAQLVQRAQAHGLALAPVAIAPQFAGTLDVPTRTSVFRGMPLAHDPTWRTGRKFPVPAAVRTQLQRVTAAGLPIDNYYIFHELSPAVAALPPEQALPYMVAPPPAARLREAQAVGSLVEFVGRLSLGALLAAGGLALAAPLALSALALDPVLMAVVASPQQGVRQGAPALWVPIAAWRY